MDRKFYNIILLIVATLMATSCSVEGYLGEGESLLYHVEQTVVMSDGSDVTPEVNDALKRSENYYLQHPNSKFLGINKMPVGLWIYSIASPTDSTFWGRYWRNLGQVQERVKSDGDLQMHRYHWVAAQGVEGQAAGAQSARSRPEDGSRASPPSLRLRMLDRPGEPAGEKDPCF